MATLSDINALGQQIWLDNLSRSLVQSGKLATLIQQGISGITSNPAIFQQALTNDPLYTAEIIALKQQNLSAKARYETLAIADIQAACDLFLTKFQATNGKTGFVSFEVSPDLAHDSLGTIAEARRLYDTVNRPNLMIKIPATNAGLAALETLVSDSININLTLLFSRKQTIKAYKSYLKGIEKRLIVGLPVHTIQVVASFFISRIDSALDNLLPQVLKGNIAVALAKAAYQDWQAFFSNTYFAALRTHGANPVQLLWASTGVKNPAYSDTLYVDNLIGHSTINTMPEATLNAFIHHGIVRNTLCDNSTQSIAVLAEVEKLGIHFETLAKNLQEDGLTQFIHAFDKLLKLLT